MQMNNAMQQGGQNSFQQQQVGKNQFNQTPQQPIAPSYTPQSYVNINATAPNPYQYYTTNNNAVVINLLNSDQEANYMQIGQNGYAFGLLENNGVMTFFIKYSDGRPMEVYDMTLREPPREPQYLTVDDFSSILDQKLDELSKKFVMRKDNSRGNGGQNG